MKFNFSLSTKLFINNIFYAVPIVVLIYLMHGSYSKELQFSQKELIGNDIQKSTMELLHLVVKNKTYSTEMDSRFSKMMSQFDMFEGDLLLDDASLADRKRAHIQKKMLLENFEGFKSGKVETGKMIKDLRELIIHTGDTSNLILDPDLDSYYMMDVTLIAAPQITERLYDVRKMLAGYVQTVSVAMSEEEKIQTAVILAMLKEADWGRIYASTTTAINEDKNFNGNDSSLQNETKNLLEKTQAEYVHFYTIMEDIAKGDKVKASSAFKMVENLIVDTQAFYVQANDTMYSVTNTRVMAVEANRNKAMTLGILAVLLAIVVSFITSKNFKTGTRKIADALSQLMGAVTVNAEASEKLTESSNSLSSVSSQQASAVQETVTSLYEINSMSERNSESIKVSTEKSDLGKEQAIMGKTAINKMASTIKNISETNNRFFNEIQTSNDELRVIVKIISDISDRTKVINDIVFQTRLLSFNASVEAARAGEHGKGFAVVAEEIGKLALISGNSAKEINDILGTATTQVETIISNMSTRVGALTEQAQIELASGEKITTECVDSLNDIVQNISELSEMMNDVSLAMAEQSKGYSEITKAINQIDEGIHYGLGLSQETSESAHKLNSQVSELRKIVKTIEKEVLGVEQAAV
jgi:methyl-accepting chemotaxis protein